jgi:colicin import membrane protein
VDGPTSTLTREALKPRQPKGMGRGLTLALIVHAGLIVAIAIGVSWRSHEPEGVAAELWSAVPQAAAPRAVEPPPPPPAPPPTPAPTPPKPAPVEAPPPPRPDAQIAIEKEKAEREKARKLEEEKERAELKKKQLAEKQKQEQEQARKQAAEKQKLEQEAQKKRLAEEAREAARSEEIRNQNLARIRGMAGASGDERATGTAMQSSGPSASYAGRIKAKIKPNIVFGEDLPNNPMAEVEVRAAPDGTITGRRLVKSSGVKEWDDAVLRAIDRTEVLPRDENGRVPSSLIIAFRPRDL